MNSAVVPTLIFYLFHSRRPNFLGVGDMRAAARLDVNTVEPHHFYIFRIFSWIGGQKLCQVRTHFKILCRIFLADPIGIVLNQQIQVLGELFFVIGRLNPSLSKFLDFPLF